MSLIPPEYGDKKVFTTAELCRMEGISASSIHRSVNDGFLVGKKVTPGKKNSPFKFKRADVEQWLRDREHDPYA